MSPSSRGIVAGLFMAGVAALSTLSANQGWLLPSLDEDGAELLAGVPAIHGVDGTLWAEGPRSVAEEWDGVDRHPLAGQGVAMAATMAKARLVSTSMSGSITPASRTTAYATGRSLAGSTSARG